MLWGSVLDIKKARQRYHAQKNQAKLRGIEWRLIFTEWLEWWGDDLDRRGAHRGQLSMQRIADSGPYALGNIRKGYPKDNARTRSVVYQTKLTLRAKAAIEAAIDAAEPIYDEPTEADDESISSYMSRDPDDIPVYRGKWRSIHR